MNTLPPISALAFYTPPQSLKLPPITNSPSPSSSPVRNSRHSYSPTSSWSSPASVSRTRRYTQQSCKLPSFRSSFAKLDNDELPVYLPPNTLPEVFLDDSEEDCLERPRALIYDEEVDKFTPRRGARSTFFDISSERGQWPTTPPYQQHTRLLKRVSAPVDTLPTLTTALPPRNSSEPAPSENGFYPPSSASVLSSPVPPSMEVETEFLPPSSPPPQTSPVLSRMTPSSPPLSPVSASSASTLLRTVSPLSLPPSSPKITTDSDWEVDATYEVTHAMSPFEKSPVIKDVPDSPGLAEASEDASIHCDPPSEEQTRAPIVAQPPLVFEEPAEVKPSIEDLTPAIEPNPSAEIVGGPCESEISLDVHPVDDMKKSPDVQPAPVINLDVPDLAAKLSPSRASTPLKDRPSSPAPPDDHIRISKRKDEDDPDLTEDEQPRKKKARRAQSAPKQRKRKAPIVHKRKATPVHGDDDGEDSEKDHPTPKKPIRRRRRLSVSSIASCSSLSSIEDDEDRRSCSPHPSESNCSKIKKAPKTWSNPEMLGLIIECFATSRASSLAPSAIYRTLTASRPQLKEERTKKEWLQLIQDVLQEGWDGNNGVFGRIESSGKDKSDRPLEARWFYTPENDDDQDRAALVKSMMPRPAKRSVTKRYKQYYYQPLGKMSRWDPEDAL